MKLAPWPDYYSSIIYSPSRPIPPTQFKLSTINRRIQMNSTTQILSCILGLVRVLRGIYSNRCAQPVGLPDGKQGGTRNTSLLLQVSEGVYAAVSLVDHWKMTSMRDLWCK